MNDINAACAGGANISAPSSTSVAQTIEERLARLAELRAKRIISEEEYLSRRAKILDEV